MRYFIAGNWKMHTTEAQARDLARAVADNSRRCPDVDVAVAPPFVWLKPVAEVLAGSPVRLAAQNVAWAEQGAYTGEISPVMLKELGCTYVIVGHSERRRYFCERDETVHLRLKAALAHGLTPILCVGETLDQRQDGMTLKVVRHQIGYALEGLPRPSELIVAYEPVWAIGTGVPAEPQQAEEVHAFIAEQVAQILGPNVALRILYGGSVKPDNIAGFLAMPHVHGALVGGASLKADQFNAILNIASAVQTA